MILVLGFWAVAGTARAAVLQPNVVADPAVGGVLAESEGCIDCHGVDGAGIGTFRPNLAGQKQNYLYKQLLHFRLSAKGEGVLGVMGRRHAVMGHNLTRLSNADLRDLAAYWAGLTCIVPTKSVPKRAPAQARRCWMCHGEDGFSHQPSIPNLAGQKEGYLVRQMEAFRANTRGLANPIGLEEAGSERSHPIMNRQVSNLSNTDIILLADYFSRLSCR